MSQPKPLFALEAPQQNIALFCVFTVFEAVMVARPAETVTVNSFPLTVTEPVLDEKVKFDSTLFVSVITTLPLESTVTTCAEPL